MEHPFRSSFPLALALALVLVVGDPPMTARNCAFLFLLCAVPVLRVHAEDLPPRAVAMLGDHHFYHGGALTHVSLSPDGKWAASVAVRSFSRKGNYYHNASFDRTIVLWDAASGERRRELETSQEVVNELLFSPDSKQLLVMCRSLPDPMHILLFDVASGKLVRQKEFEGNLGNIGPLFSSDGKQLFLIEGRNTVIALDSASWKELGRWHGPAAGGNWIKDNEVPVCGIPSPDGKFIAWLIAEEPDALNSGLPHVVVMSDAATKTMIHRKEFGRNSCFIQLHFSADGRWFMLDYKNSIAWETTTGKELFRLPHNDWDGLVVSPDGRLAITKGGGRCRLYDIETRKQTHEIVLDGANSAWGANTAWDYYGQIFSADGKTVALHNLSTLRLFDTATGQERLPRGHCNPIAVRFSADGKTLFSTCAELRSSWDLASGKNPTLLTRVPRNSWDRGGRYGPCNDSSYFLQFQRNLIRIGDTATGKFLHEIPQEGEASGGWFSPDGTRLALCCEQEQFLALYDTKTVTLSGKIELKSGPGSKFMPTMFPVQPIFSPDGRMIAILDASNRVHFHDAVTGKLIRKSKSSQAIAACGDGALLFAPDGSRIIGMSDELTIDEFGQGNGFGRKLKQLPARVFDVASGQEIRRFYLNPEKPEDDGEWSCFACSPDNRLLAVADVKTNSIRLLEIDSGLVRAEFKGHLNGVYDLAFSPDGRFLASGGNDNVIYLWDVVGTTALPPGKIVKDTDLEHNWSDLALGDSQRVGVAIASLIAAGDQSVKVLERRLKPVAPVDVKRVAILLEQLDSESFEERDSATKELALLNYHVEDLLRAELKKDRSLEAALRIKTLLEKINDLRLSPGAPLQTIRAIEVLERIGTPDAKALCKKMATGAPDAWETKAAKAAVGRGNRSE